MCSFGKLLDAVVVDVLVVSPQVAGVDVGGRHDVGVVKNGHDAHDDALDTLGRRPVLVRGLVLVDVARLVEDGYADPPVGVDVWVEDRRAELEGGRREGVVERKVHLCLQVRMVPGRLGVDDVKAQGPVEDAVVVERDVVGGVSGELLELFGEKHGCGHVCGMGL